MGAEEDAELFLAELRERLAKFRLELHPEKTRLIAFGRFALLDRQRRGLKGSPETFNFLGFTHICAVSKRGRFVLGRHTMRQRLTAKLKLLKAEMLRRRHQPIPQQGKWLASVVRGHMAYYAVPTNILPVGSFRNQVAKSWHRALLRRSQRSRLDWSRMGRLINRWLPTVRIIHPWPDERFDVRTQGKSRVRSAAAQIWCGSTSGRGFSSRASALRSARRMAGWAEATAGWEPRSSFEAIRSRRG